MDIDSAIQAHSNWKLRLFNYARGKPAGEIDLQSLWKDDFCLLDRWLQDEGRKYSDHPKFARLLETHSAFHACAASLGALLERGQGAQVQSQLGSPDSEINRLSFRLVAILLDLCPECALA